MGRQGSGGEGGSRQPGGGGLERTLLSNERTFLSWARAAIDGVALGLVAAQLLPRQNPRTAALVEAIGAILVILGIFLAVSGHYRYFLNLREAQQGRFAPATTSVNVSIILIVVAGVMALVLLLLL